jgi:adenosine deaminase
VLQLAARNGIDIPYKTLADFDAALAFRHIEDFFTYHMNCFEVIRTKQDIHETTLDFLARCEQENIRHVELTFAPQQYFDNGLSPDDLMDGLASAMAEGRERHGVSSVLVMCINRQFSEDSALEMLRRMAPHAGRIAGLGLCAYEKDNPPVKFERAYAEARRQGLRLTAHCDCDMENSTTHIFQCIHVLGVERIDHGVNAIERDDLVQALVEKKIPLTICPTWWPTDTEPSNLARLRALHERGVTVTVNSDDPTEMPSGYLTQILLALHAHGFSLDELVQFTRNAFAVSWIGEADRARHLAALDAYVREHATAA